MLAAATRCALSCDDDPKHFDAILKKVARHKPVVDASVPKREDQAKNSAKKSWVNFVRSEKRPNILPTNGIPNYKLNLLA